MKALPELQAAKTTSLHPAEIWRCLRLKVWDVAAQRMVSLDDVASPARSEFTNLERDSENEKPQRSRLEENAFSNQR